MIVERTVTARLSLKFELSGERRVLKRLWCVKVAENLRVRNDPEEPLIEISDGELLCEARSEDVLTVWGEVKI